MGGVRVGDSFVVSADVTGLGVFDVSLTVLLESPLVLVGLSQGLDPRPGLPFTGAVRLQSLTDNVPFTNIDLIFLATEPGDFVFVIEGGFNLLGGREQILLDGGPLAVAVVPLPAAGLLFASALAGLGFVAARRRRTPA